MAASYTCVKVELLSWEGAIALCRARPSFIWEPLPLDLVGADARLARFAAAVESGADALDWSRPTSLEGFLDGLVYGLLRAQVPREHRQAIGAYFTGTKLGRRVVRGLGAVHPSDVVVDPTCGTGDLLLRYCEALPLEANVEETIAAWTKRLRGCDTESAFVDIARRRLFVMAHARHGARPQRPMRVADFDGVVHSDYRRALPAFSEVTQVLMNPPFCSVPTPAGTTWSTGLVNQAAVIALDVLDVVPNGARVSMVLPDVLRSGSRYRNWRNLLFGQITDRRAIAVGQFDRWTDVDVFLLTGIKGRGRRPALPSSKGNLGARFNVTVGPLVDYRDPHTGPWARVIKSSTIRSGVFASRRTNRRQHVAPFLAVSRTSSPSDTPRIRARIFETGGPFVVENHAIVIRQPEDDVEALRALLNGLGGAAVDTWLNRRLRCRHLTTTALREIPWRLL